MNDSANNTQTLNFQAEVGRLLHIVAHSLYSEQEIFLRELISNASDACDKLRYAAITQPELVGGDTDYAINLIINKTARQLEIADNGIGMNREELVDHLGTIARSGTLAFVEQVAANQMADKTEKHESSSLIGQFGVGFYSAFMVASAVTVITRRAGESDAWRWHSTTGEGSFTIGAYLEGETVSEGPAPERGCRVILTLAEGMDEYLESERLRNIVQKYSDHVGIPIRLIENDTSEDSATDPAANKTITQLNKGRALWMRAKSDITEEQYQEFYHHVAHAGDNPWLTLHFRAEGVLEYNVLLFVPTTRPFDLFHPDRKNRAKLYVRRVFVTDDCPELLPSWLRFLRGVVDSEDLPLNVSRELLQNNPMLQKMRSAIVKRMIEALGKRAEEDKQGYADFWKQFGLVVKEGLYEDFTQNKNLLTLLRFRTTKTEENDMPISFADYMARMRPGQEAIYYITGETEAALRASPQLEGFLARDIEVLLLTDPVDDFWLQMSPKIEGKDLKSITRSGMDLSGISGPETTEDQIDSEAKESKKSESQDIKSEQETESIADVIALMKLRLQDRVKDVRRSDRLTDSPVCLVAEEGDMDMHLERMLRMNKQLDTGSGSRRILEINPDHKLIQSLAQAVKRDGDAPWAGAVADLLLDQALLLEGEPLPDPTGFARRLSLVMERGLSVTTENINSTTES